MPPYPGTATTTATTITKTTATKTVNGSVTSDASPDYRHPLYLGTWIRSIPKVDPNIRMDDLDEPHMKRRLAILQSHPDITELSGPDTRTIYIAILSAATQIALAYYFGKVQTEGLLAFLVVAYLIGASFTALYGVIIHEACHNLASPSPFVNRIVMLVANLAMPVPIAMSFRRYHLEHHTFQGVVGMDPDLPLEWEKALIGGNPFLKLIWILIYPIMYIVRGAAMQKRPTFWELVNLGFTVIADCIIWFTCGPRGLAYLATSVYFGYSLHPGAAHFIQEHYTFTDGQETYSYYGLLNNVFMNIGYHNEHHDFTHVAWSKLPLLRSKAREFYDPLSYHTSWVMVHWNFIMNPTMGPQSRLGRDLDAHKKGRKMLGLMQRARVARK